MRKDICFVHDHKGSKVASVWPGLLAQLEEICAHSHQALGGSGWPSTAVLGIVGKPGVLLKPCQKTLVRHCECQWPGMLKPLGEETWREEKRHSYRRGRDNTRKDCILGQKTRRSEKKKSQDTNNCTKKKSLQHILLQPISPLVTPWVTLDVLMKNSSFCLSTFFQRASVIRLLALTSQTAVFSFSTTHTHTLIYTDS